MFADYFGRMGGGGGGSEPGIGDSLCTTESPMPESFSK